MGNHHSFDYTGYAKRHLVGFDVHLSAEETEPDGQGETG